MKIAIVWYGRMGVLIEHHAKEKWYEIAVVIDPIKWTKKEDLLNIDFDVAIEFSIPKVALENMKFYAENDMKVVMATTGWYDELETIKWYFKDSKWALLWSGNFSLGVNLFWKMIENASKIMDKFEDYDVFGHEFHHNKKADSPSGTLINTGTVVLENMSRKEKIVTETLVERPIEGNELHLTSTRGGSIPWTHSIYFDSPFDTIEIKHTARTRDGFAIWAIVCAKWLKDKNWYFEMRDFMREVV